MITGREINLRCTEQTTDGVFVVHNFTLEIELRGKTNPSSGEVFNQASFKSLVNELKTKFSNLNLNEAFGEWPTLEMLLTVIRTSVLTSIPGWLVLHRLRLSESNQWAEWLRE